MKIFLSRANDGEQFDEIDVKGNEGESTVEKIRGQFFRVSCSVNGEEIFQNIVLGAELMRGSFSVPPKISISTPLGYLSYSIERGLDKKKSKDSQQGSRIIKSSMPGRVVRVLVKVGDEVSVGQPVLVLEAMKMENEITSPMQGVVEKIAVAPEKKVETGEILLTVSSQK